MRVVRIAVVTGSRAEYGLLHPLLTAFEVSPQSDAFVIVTGSHLSERFGMTVGEIEADGFRIGARVELPLKDDTVLGVARATGVAVSGIAAVLAADMPDIMLVLGDRYEVLAAAVAATLMRIPVAHLHGGELTEGAVDDSIRHAITKLATLHFTSTEEYRRRVLQMGEEPGSVFTVGALGIDNAIRTKLLPPSQLASQIGFEFTYPTALATFHSVTHAEDSGVAQMDALLGAFDDIPELRVVFTLPNADAGNATVRARVESWVARNSHRAVAFASLGRVRYLSALAACDVVVGNSSSGIIEAPSFGKPSVDIGERQRGRIRTDSVRHCEPERAAVSAAIAASLTPEAREAAIHAVNPYGDGCTAERIVSVILAEAPGLSTCKRFIDIHHSLES